MVWGPIGFSRESVGCRVELEERRARNECDAAEGNEELVSHRRGRGRGISIGWPSLDNNRPAEPGYYHAGESPTYRVSDPYQTYCASDLYLTCMRPIFYTCIRPFQG